MIYAASMCHEKITIRLIYIEKLYDPRSSVDKYLHRQPQNGGRYNIL